MAQHQITIEDIQASLESMEHLIASSYGKGSSKKLVAVSGGGLRVIDHGKIVWEGFQMFPAMEAYNACQ